MIYYIEIVVTPLTKVLHELSVQLTNPISRRLVNKSIDASRIQIQANNQTETYRHSSPQDKEKSAYWLSSTKEACQY